MKFSVIIPVYNVAPYIRACLDSLLIQTFRDFEAICVDDGSTDGSGVILDEYAAKDSRIRVVHKRNEGVSIARNWGIEVATGEYLGFVDSDDVLAKKWLEYVWKAFKETDCSLVKMGFTAWHGEECLPNVSNVCRCFTYEGVEKDKWGVLAAGVPWRNFYRREQVKDVRYPEGLRIHEDSIYYNRCLMMLNRATECDYAGYFYRVRPDSAVRTKAIPSEVVRYAHELVSWYNTYRVHFESEQLNDCISKRVADAITDKVMHCISQASLHKVGDPLARALDKLKSGMDFDVNRKSGPMRVAYEIYLKFGWPGSVRIYWLLCSVGRHLVKQGKRNRLGLKN